MSILVPIDLSAPSRCAIELAALLAKAVPCEPVLLHVTREQPALEYLAALYALASPIHALGINARLRTLPGVPAAVVREEAIRREARWIVMGTRGAHLGEDSVARQVMESCPIPVVAIRPAQGAGLNPAAPHLPGSSLGNRIVIISSDSSDDRELRHIGGYLARLGGELEVQPVVESFSPGKGPRTRPNDLVITTAMQDWKSPWFNALMEDRRHFLVLVSQPPHR